MDGNGIRRGSTGHARVVKPGLRDDGEDLRPEKSRGSWFTIL